MEEAAFSCQPEQFFEGVHKKGSPFVLHFTRRPLLTNNETDISSPVTSPSVASTGLDGSPNILLGQRQA